MADNKGSDSGGLADFVALIACMGCFMYALGVSQATIIAWVTTAGAVVFAFALLMAAFLGLVVAAAFLGKIILG